MLLVLDSDLKFGRLLESDPLQLRSLPMIFLSRYRNLFTYLRFIKGVDQNPPNSHYDIGVLAIGVVAYHYQWRR